MPATKREQGTKVKYPFADENGKVVYVKYPFGEAPDIGVVIEYRGRKLQRLSARDVADDAAMVQPPGNWPMRSMAMGVPAHQVAEAREFYRQRGGYQPKFDPKTGEAILSSRKDRRECMAAMTLFDQDAGYGDRGPTTRAR